MEKYCLLSVVKSCAIIDTEQMFGCIFLRYLDEYLEV